MEPQVRVSVGSRLSEDLQNRLRTEILLSKEYLDFVFSDGRHFLWPH